MTRIQFQRAAGYVATPGSPTSPLTNVAQLVAPPVGPHRDWLTARGWPFTGNPRAAYLTATLSRTLFDLQDAGILGVLDFLFLSTGYLAGSVKNWVPGRPDAQVSGVTMAGGALVTQGSAGSYFGASLAAEDRTHFEVDSASVFAFLTDTPPTTGGATTPVIGGNASSLRLARNSASPFVLHHLNASAPTGAVPSALTASDWRPGLWGMNRSAGVGQLIRDGAVIRTNTPGGSEARATLAYVGRYLETYAAQQFTAFGGGGALSTSQWATLARILRAHATEITASA